MKVSLFQGILIGVFALGALIGLFVFSNYTSKNTGNTGVGTVVIWGTLPGSAMKAALADVVKKDTSLKSVSYVQKDEATLPSDLAAAIATGAAPDLVLASQENLESLAKFLTPIPLSTLSANTFQNSFVREGQIFTVPNGGGFYGVPLLVDPLVLFSNPTILSSDGIVKPPATWEALTGLVPNVAVLTPTKQITRGLVALGTYDNVHDARGILSTLFFQTGVPVASYSLGGILSADLGASASAGVPPGQAVLNFYTQFADPSKVSYTWNGSLPDSEQAFLAGDLALYLGYASEAQYFSTANPNLAFEVTPVPEPAAATAKTAYGLIYALMIPRGAKNVSGAYLAATALAGAPAQSALASDTGLAPATLTNLAAAPPDPTAAVAYSEALYAAGWLSPAPADTDSVFSAMIGNVISGRSTLTTALSTAQSSLSALLQQQ
ncbi:MAG TPA: extracellular solute-binding protein [Candidatus Paceibacterota bacterium]|nr:extracellular solute-binding protein [Candidatus Paceibacterota bacterium]